MAGRPDNGRIEKVEEGLAAVMAELKQLTELLHGKFSVLEEVDQRLQSMEDYRRKGKGILEAPETASSEKNPRPRPAPHPPWESPTYHRGGQPRDQLARKLDLPVFTGDDSENWVFRAERYFSVNQILESEQMEAVGVCLEGEALTWFRWEDGRQTIPDWPPFKGLLMDRFRSSQEGSVYERFLALTQKGSVREYRNEFELLASPMQDIPETVLEGQFVNGLHPLIKAEVRLLQPQWLLRIMDVAQRVEDRNSLLELQKHPSKNFVSRSTAVIKPISVIHNTYPTNLPNQLPSVHKLLPTIPITSQEMGKGAPAFRRLFEAEMQQKRAKGLCYRCDEKFTFGHRCARKELQILLALEDELSDLSEKEELEEDQSGPVAAVETMELSAKSIIRISSPRTLKLKGLLQLSPVVMLVDSGATHNFISTSLTQVLQLPSSGQHNFEVILGTGTRVRGQGRIEGVEILCQGHKLLVDLLPLELGSVDIILGMQWLRTLGDTRIIWEKFRISFQKAGEEIVLQGDPSICVQQSTMRGILKEFQISKHGLLVEIRSLSTETLESVNPEASWLSDLADYQHLFQPPVTLSPRRLEDHSIPLKLGTNPVRVRPFRYPQAQKEIIEKLVKDMLAARVIRPSTSPFSSPVILVRKKDGSWRFCVDYRALNRVTVPDRFPIPNIDELLDELHGAVIFSKLDLRSGYHQICVTPEDIPKTAFGTHEGHYEFVVMPFGLSNAPATFQVLMNSIFRLLLRKFVLIFFDDVLIYSKTREEHPAHVRQVLDLMSHNELRLNPKKCQFNQASIAYLGHIISASGLSVDQDKISVMRDWPIPRTLREVRGFLGLTGYYRRFVRGYGQLAKPFTDLLKKDGFIWSDSAEEAFQLLKNAMTTVPVLGLQNFSQEFVLETDASGHGLGAVLMQQQRPLAYFSHALGPKGELKSVYERELMTIVFAIRKWRHYLLGRKFTVRTDQRSLKFLLEQKEVNPYYQKWLSKLLGYDFDIQYKPGAKNSAADALSRFSFPVSLFALSCVHSITLQYIDSAVRENTDLHAIISLLQADPGAKPGYTYIGGHLLYRGRLVLPKDSALTRLVLAECHDSSTGGHSGILKTLKRVQLNFYWQGIKKMVTAYVTECSTCQRSKYSILSPAGLLQPLPIPDQIWDDIFINFIEGLPTSKGFNTILVVVDRLSKYGHFIPLTHPFTAPKVAELFVHAVVRLHGIPKSIVSDRDKIFLSHFWKELFRLQGTVLKHSTAYHSQSDGQTEVVNRCLETYLRCFVTTKPNTWAKWILWAEYWYNTSFHTSASTTPFRAVYGRDPPLLVPFDRGLTANSLVDQQLVQRDQILDDLKINLQRAQMSMKKQADKNRRDVEFSEGEHVFLKLRPYSFKSLTKGTNAKLSPKFFGPYRVLKRIGKAAYKLKLPDSSSIHPVFHVSQLKPAVGADLQSVPLPTQLDDASSVCLYPEEVLGIRMIQGDPNHKREVLIRWKNLPDTESSWELEDNILQQFPHFHLEDKVNLVAGSIDKDQGLKVYSRRPKKSPDAGSS